VIPAVADAVAALEQAPVMLDAWLRHLPEGWLDARTEGLESFSPRDVLGHLISGERRDWIPRMRIILDHGEARAFDPFDRFAFREEIAGKPVGALLEEFSMLRRQSLADLRDLNLVESDLARRGKHPEASFGPVTLGNLLATWTVHDLSHVGQIARVMAKRYADAVGPWKAYLPVLTR
jgi:hypothetical protein